MGAMWKGHSRAGTRGHSYDAFPDESALAMARRECEQVGESATGRPLTGFCVLLFFFFAPGPLHRRSSRRTLFRTWSLLGVWPECLARAAVSCRVPPPLPPPPSLGSWQGLVGSVGAMIGECGPTSLVVEEVGVCGVGVG